MCAVRDVTYVSGCSNHLSQVVSLQNIREISLRQ